MVFTFIYHPLIERSVRLKFQSAYTVRYALHCILYWMCKVVHGVNAPSVACVVVRKSCYAVEHGVAHVNVAARHVYLGAEHFFTVSIFAVTHILKEP